MTFLIPFYEEYAAAHEEIEEAKKLGTKPKKELPAPVDLKELAQREGLNYEMTPLLSREQAEQFGQIAGAEVGMSRLSGGRKFADEFFDPKKALYEPEELTDLLGTRFLARKIKDVPPHVPALDEVRPEVSLAWKMAKARPLAEKAAQELAEKLKKKARRAQGRHGRRFSRRDDSRRSRACKPISWPADSSPGPPRKPRSPTSPMLASRSERPTSTSSPARWPSRPTNPAPSITSWSPSVASPPPSPRSMPPTVTSIATRCPQASRRSGSSMSSGWAGCESKRAWTATGFLPTRPRASRRPTTTT